MMIPAYIKYLYSGLLTVVISVYSFSAVAKSAAGIGVPYNLLATIDAPCVFFYVVAQAQPFSGLWCLCLHHGSIEIMVVRAGQPSGWPVSNKAGYANPVRAATSEIGVSGGSNNRYLLRLPSWLQSSPRHTRNMSLCLPQSAVLTLTPASVCFALSPAMSVPRAVC